MSKNFSSIVKLVNPSGGSGREEEITTQTRSTTGESTLLQWDTRTVTLPAIQPLPLSAQRPEQLQPARFWFDRVFSSSDTQVDIYKKAVKDIVESCLLGYHGTVISFGTTGVQIELDMRAEKEDFVICKAAEQIFRCLKKSRQSESRSSTSNLVMLCSSVIITHEKVYDLLFGYPSTVDDELPPELSLVNGRVLGASQLKVKGGKVAPLLRYGREVERRILDYRKSLNVQDQGAYHGSGRTHHKVFTLSVEYSQFGSMNSPVSGNLMFVDVAPSDPLTNRQRHTIGDEIAPGYLSLFTLADIVNSLTPNTAIVEGGVGSSGSTYDVIDEVQSSQLPCVPETTSKELYQNSVLTQLLQDSLGGNCKTLLMSYVPELVLPIRYGELYETLKLASRARLIQNAPNKRDLAEKALMSAYMRGLQEMYGQGVLAKREEKKPQKRRMPPSFVTPFNEGADATSISSDEIDTAYDEMINITGEKR